MCALYSFKYKILGTVYVDVWLLFRRAKDIRISRVKATLFTEDTLYVYLSYVMACNKVLYLHMKERERRRIIT
jgi:hypothetical protein